VVDHQGVPGWGSLDQIPSLGDGLHASRRQLLGRDLFARVGRGVGRHQQHLAAGCGGCSAPVGVKDLVRDHHPQGPGGGTQQSRTVAGDGVTGHGRQADQVGQQGPGGHVLSEGHTMDLVVAVHHITVRSPGHRGIVKSGRSHRLGYPGHQRRAEGTSQASHLDRRLRAGDGSVQFDHALGPQDQPKRWAQGSGGDELGPVHHSRIDLGLTQAPGSAALHHRHPEPAHCGAAVGSQAAGQHQPDYRQGARGGPDQSLTRAIATWLNQVGKGRSDQRGQAGHQEGAPQPQGRRQGTGHLAQVDAAHRNATEGPGVASRLGQDQHGGEGCDPPPPPRYQDRGHRPKERLYRHQESPATDVEGGREVEAGTEQGDAGGQSSQAPSPGGKPPQAPGQQAQPQPGEGPPTQRWHRGSHQPAGHHRRHHHRAPPVTGSRPGSRAPGTAPTVRSAALNS